MPLWNPRTWAGWTPIGLGQVKPHHYWEILRTAWENRDRIGYSLRILRHGVCDGCALGTTGWRDWTLPGVHLCMIRLRLLRLNTAPAMNPERLGDVRPLRALNNRSLRRMGRLAHPMRRRRGEKGFQRISWDEALDELADRVRRADPRRLAFYLTSRGITNETYYVAQKVARFLGTNHIDNSARICHSPSTVALKQSLGVSASTCSYKDWIGSDLIVLFGSDVPNNQPVTTKYLYEAKRRGSRIVVINPYQEPGLERYWIPSVTESALFGTRLADSFFAVHTGGDRAFILGVLKAMLANGGIDMRFVESHTIGFEAVRERATGTSWAAIESASGSPRREMERFAALYAAARTAVFIWSMGITQHPFGVDNVQAIINLALARGMVGREHCGLMPIRGHSGVQGGAEMGAVPNRFPGGRGVDESSARAMEAWWGFPVPSEVGLRAPDMIEEAHLGNLEVLWSIGGSFTETLPDPSHVSDALGRLPVRVHQDIVVSPSMLLEPGETVFLLPATTRYEQEGGGTETTTERRIVFSPEIPGPRVGQTRSEWKVLVELATRVNPDRAERIAFADAASVREEISRIVEAYAGIETLSKRGDMVQWGGPRLCEGWAFGLPDGRARWVDVPCDGEGVPPGKYRVSTRRGKQFNSMHWSDRDPLNGARREDVLMSPEDCEALDLRPGERIVLRSEWGRFAGRVRVAPIRPGNLQVHWPEANFLLRRGRLDERCGVPDYNALVEIEKGHG